MTIDRRTLLKYDPLPGPRRRRSRNDLALAIAIAILGMIMIVPLALLGVSSSRALQWYLWAAGGIGILLTLLIAYLGFRDGGLLGAYHRLRYPLANWGEFGPTGGRFIDHDDDWMWRRYAIAWLYLWLWLALPLVATLR